MSATDYVYRVLIANILTLYYSVQMLILFALAYLKNPFSDPWAPKLKLEPPSRLTDPKYGNHKYIKVNNTKLHYVESGDPSKPMLLFLHGFPEFWYSWRHQIVEFQKDYWCIALDMRGYGDSERPEGLSSYHLDVLVEDIRDLIRQLGREKCILVAHDWGGLVACHLREVHPETLSGLIVMASSSSTAWLREIWTNTEQRKKSWYVFMYRAPMIGEKLMQLNDLAFFNQAMLTQGNTATDQEDIECYKYWYRKPYALTPPINYYRANFRYDLPEIVEFKENIPMIVAYAADDPYLNPSLMDTMQKQYGCEKTIVENTGHFLHQESPEKVNKLIKEFLHKHSL